MKRILAILLAVVMALSATVLLTAMSEPEELELKDGTTVVGEKTENETDDGYVITWEKEDNVKKTEEEVVDGPNRTENPDGSTETVTETTTKKTVTKSEGSETYTYREDESYAETYDEENLTDDVARELDSIKELLSSEDEDVVIETDDNGVTTATTTSEYEGTTVTKIATEETIHDDVEFLDGVRVAVKEYTLTEIVTEHVLLDSYDSQWTKEKGPFEVKTETETTTTIRTISYDVKGNTYQTTVTETIVKITEYVEYFPAPYDEDSDDTENSITSTAFYVYDKVITKEWIIINDVKEKTTTKKEIVTVKTTPPPGEVAGSSTSRKSTPAPVIQPEIVDVTPITVQQTGPAPDEGGEAGENDAPPTPTPPAETQADEPDAPEAPVETVPVEEAETPLVQISKNSVSGWHLWNLILSIATVAMAIAMAVRTLASRRKDEHMGDESKSSSRSIILNILLPVVAVASCLVFILTQDMSMAMGMVDGWTVLHAAFLLAGVTCFILDDRKEEKTGAKA